MEPNKLKQAVMHLQNDNLEGCHALVQEEESPDANYLHGILHRREKDFDNAAYWFRRIGRHPVVGMVMKKFPDYDPLPFLALCRNATPEERETLTLIQAEEVRCFLDYAQTQVSR